MAMSRTGLIDALREKIVLKTVTDKKTGEDKDVKLTKEQAKNIVETIESVIIDEVCNGDGVALQGFMTFTKEHKEARMGRNPQTGEEIPIDAKDVPKVKISKAFKDVVAGVR